MLDLMLFLNNLVFLVLFYTSHLRMLDFRGVFSTIHLSMCFFTKDAEFPRAPFRIQIQCRDDLRALYNSSQDAACLKHQPLCMSVYIDTSATSVAQAQQTSDIPSGHPGTTIQKCGHCPNCCDSRQTCLRRRRDGALKF